MLEKRTKQASIEVRAMARLNQRPRRTAEPITCRVCHRSLIDAAERKIGRCETCPSDLDPELYEALRKDPHDREAVRRFVGRVRNAARASRGERPFGSL